MTDAQPCFWHRHPGCKDATIPKTHTDFWQNKFDRNVANDKKHIKDLEEMGFRVVVIWECEITKHFDETMARLEEILGPPHHPHHEH